MRSLVVACLLATLACGAPPAPTPVPSGSTGPTVSPPPPPPPPPAPEIHRLTVTVDGSGRVTSDPAGLDCPQVCAADFAAGTTVRLKPTAAENWMFGGFAGSCSGDSCAPTLSADLSVGARFTPIPPGPVDLVPPDAGAANDCTPAAGVYDPDAGSASTAEPDPSQCAGIAAPDPVVMRQWVHPAIIGSCGDALADGTGTFAFGYHVEMYQLGNQYYGISFVTADGQFLNDQFLAPGRGSGYAVQQPRGIFGATNIGWPAQYRWEVKQWTGSAMTVVSTPLFLGDRLGVVADPAGGLLIAGSLSLGSSSSNTDCSTCTPSVLMYEAPGDGAPSVRWGPTAYASAGRFLGAGVDTSGRALIVTDGSRKFGGTAVSAQWLDRDGAPMTGEFMVVPCATGGSEMTVESTPLIGGGLMLWGLGWEPPPSYQRVIAPLAVVESGAAMAHPPPAWISSRSNARLQIARGGRAYAVLPKRANGVSCTQRVELRAPNGALCATADYPIAEGTCDTGDLALGADGTIIQPLPHSMETQRDMAIGTQTTCTWRWWPGALK